MLIGGAKNV